MIYFDLLESVDLEIVVWVNFTYLSSFGWIIKIKPYNNIKTPITVPTLVRNVFSIFTLDKYRANKDPIINKIIPSFIEIY